MIKVLLDTNIIMDAVCQRAGLSDAGIIMKAVENEKIEGYITSGTFYNLSYLIDITLKKRGIEKHTRVVKARQILASLLDYVTVIHQTNDDFRLASTDITFEDIEDSCQYQAALKQNCQYLITQNIKDFKNAEGTTSVTTPQAFVNIIDL